MSAGYFGTSGIPGERRFLQLSFFRGTTALVLWESGVFMRRERTFPLLSLPSDYDEVASKSSWARWKPSNLIIFTQSLIQVPLKISNGCKDDHHTASNEHGWSDFFPPHIAGNLGNSWHPYFERLFFNLSRDDNVNKKDASYKTHEQQCTKTQLTNLCNIGRNMNYAKIETETATGPYWQRKIIATSNASRDIQITITNRKIGVAFLHRLKNRTTNC